MPTPVALTLACFLQAAAHQGIPAPVMWGLYSTEGGWVGASEGNRDGSHDLGPMQINDATWVGPIADLLFASDRAKAREALQWDGCFNAEVSAWVLHQYLVEDHGDLAAAVGHYNSHNPESMRRYQEHYAARFLALYGQQLAASPVQPIPRIPGTAPAPRTPPVNAYLSGTVSPPAGPPPR